MRRAACLALALQLGGCTTLSTFSTDPPGAKLYVNGRYLGQTPAQITAPRTFGRRYHVQVMKDGYQAQDFYVDSRLSWPMGYLAPLFLPLLFWGWALDSEYLVHLPSLGDAPADGASPASQMP